MWGIVRETFDAHQEIVVLVCGTSALTRVLRSDGVASVMNLGRGAK